MMERCQYETYDGCDPPSEDYMCNGKCFARQEEVTMAKCPDCKVKVTPVTQTYVKTDGIERVGTTYYFCPVCKQNFDEKVVILEKGEL